MHAKTSLILISLYLTVLMISASCPQYLTQGSNENETVISLNVSQDIEKDKLTYEWDVIVRTTGFPYDLACNVAMQPCYLIAWKSARALKTYLVLNQCGFMDNSNVSINNALIKIGVMYQLEFKVSFNGKALDNKCFEIINSQSLITNSENATNDDDEEAKHEFIESSEVELYLIGPEKIFCSSTLLIHAFVVGNHTNLLLQWKLKEIGNKTIINLNNRGSNMEIQANSLKSGKTYEITCEVFRNNELMNAEMHNVKVRKAKNIIRLLNKNQTLGANQPIKIMATIEIPSDINYKVIWTCKTNEKSCGQFTDMNTLYIDKGFSDAGLYEFELTISNIDPYERQIAFVNVIINSVRSIEFDAIAPWIPTSEPFEIIGHIDNLMTGCFIKWLSINDINIQNHEEYKQLNLTQTGYNGTIVSFVKHDLFLKELATFSNDTGRQQHSLTIQPELLRSQNEAKYLIRLEASCKPGEVVFSDLEFVTNTPPVINELIVEPTSGMSLYTLFKFETIPAKDKLGDYPLTYEFGWLTKDINNNTEAIYFEKMQTFYVVEGILPCLGKNETLQTVLRVCDNKGSCDVRTGPEINVKLAEVSVDDHIIFERKIKSTLESNDLEKFAIEVKTILKTYINLKNEILYEDMEKEVNTLLNAKMKYLLGETLNDETRNEMRDVIACMLLIEGDFRATSQLVQNLIKIRGLLMNEEMMSRIVTDDDLEALDVIEGINNKPITSLTLEDVTKYFEATEFIITSSDEDDLVEQEKDNFIKNLDKYLGELCVLLYQSEKKNFKFKLKTAYIMLEKFSNTYFNSFKYIPNIENQWQEYIQIKLNQSWFMDVRSKQLCMGKAILKDYLNHKGLLYFAKLFTSTMNEIKLDTQPNTITKLNKDSKEFTCSVNRDDSWHQCRNSRSASSNLICVCDQMGYYRIDNMNQVISTTVPSTTIRSTSFTTRNVFTQTTQSTINNNNSSQDVTTPSTNINPSGTGAGNGQNGNEDDGSREEVTEHGTEDYGEDIDIETNGSNNNNTNKTNNNNDIDNNRNNNGNNSANLPGSRDNSSASNGNTTNADSEGAGHSTTPSNGGGDQTTPHASGTTNNIVTESVNTPDANFDPPGSENNSNGSNNTNSNENSEGAGHNGESTIPTPTFSTTINVGEEPIVNNNSGSGSNSENNNTMTITTPRSADEETNNSNANENGGSSNNQTGMGTGNDNNSVTASNGRETTTISGLRGNNSIDGNTNLSNPPGIANNTNTNPGNNRQPTQPSTNNNNNNNDQQGSETTTLGPLATTSNIRSAGFLDASSLSTGDKISFGVIGLCIFGIVSLVIFGVVSKRVRKVRTVETEQSAFPMYADIFQKETMHAEFRQ